MINDTGICDSLRKFSVFPTRLLSHVGFLLHLHHMTIRILQEKAEKVQGACRNLQRKPHIRDVAQVWLPGILFPAVPSKKFHYRSLENDKI